MESGFILMRKFVDIILYMIFTQTFVHCYCGANWLVLAVVFVTERHFNPEVLNLFPQNLANFNFSVIFVFGDLSLCSIGVRTSESCYF